MNETTKLLIYLLSCSVNGIPPENRRLKCVNAEELFLLSKSHLLTFAVCHALEETDFFDDASPDIKSRFSEAKEKALRKNILFESERAEIINEMEKAGIRYMPLKGCVLGALYPIFGMRQMADIDILYDLSFREKLKEIMLSNGYDAKSIGFGTHDIYRKSPVFNFEMHTALFGKTHGKTLYGYYLNVWDRLSKDAENSFGYHFSDEDFYVYMIAHAYKHYKISGTGIRFLLDIFVYNKSKCETLNNGYIKNELSKLGLSSFEENCRTLSNKLFSSPDVFPELTENESVTFSYLLGSGAYGNVKNRVANELGGMYPDGITRKAKRKYLFCRLFPGNKWFISNVPFCEKHPLLIPFYCIFRISRAVFTKRKQIGIEIKAVKELK